MASTNSNEETAHLVQAASAHPPTYPLQICQHLQQCDVKLSELCVLTAADCSDAEVVACSMAVEHAFCSKMSEHNIYLAAYLVAETAADGHAIVSAVDFALVMEKVRFSMSALRWKMALSTAML